MRNEFIKSLKKGYRKSKRIVCILIIIGIIFEINPYYVKAEEKANQEVVLH